MRDYHFEDDDQTTELEETIRLDAIHETVKALEKKTEDDLEDLGDKDAFLNAFESERLTPQESVSEYDDISQKVIEDITNIENLEDLEDTEDTEDTERTLDLSQTQEIQPIQQTQQTQPIQQTQSMHSMSAEKQNVQNAQEPKTTQNKEDVADLEETEESASFWNKKTIGLATIGCILVVMVCFGLARMFFAPKEIPLTPGTPRPVLITSILAQDELLVYDLQSGKQTTLQLSEDTKIYNEKNVVIVSDILEEGDLVLATLDSTGNVTISLSYNGITQMEATDLQMDTTASVLRSEDGTQTYHYQKNSKFLYQGEALKPSELAPCDVLTLYLVEDILWLTEVNSYHGYFIVTNTGNIQNGKIQIDTQDAIALSEVSRMPLAEGTHTVTITGDNIETRQDTLFIESGEEVTYDLSRAQEKMGVLVIQTNVTDYKLYINGTLTDSTQPAVLPFGTYDVVILKNGYTDWNQTVTINQSTVTVQAELEESIQYGTLAITCNEPDAHIIINGVEQGIAPLQIKLPTGLQVVEIYKEGFATYRQEVELTQDTVHIDAILQP